MIAPGTLVDDRYTVVRLAAEGGMSEIYEVTDARLPGRFALKRMREWIGDARIRDEMNEQFDREANVLSTLSHPNLPRVTDHFVHEGCRCLVEEFVDGRTLEQLAEAAALGESDVVAHALQICDALEYLHGKGIIYRDLKPSNCMISLDGSVKLIDFGIVRFFSTGKSRDTVIMGTPGFAAPEQCGREQTDARADIFALGVLLHHLLTGHDPTDTPFVFPRPRSLNPGLSERTERIILKAVALDPEERFASISEMRDALRGEAVLLEDAERFVYAEEPPSPGRFAATSAGVLGAGAAATVLTAGNWGFSMLSFCYTPLWLALLAIQFIGRRRRARTSIEVTRDGIRWVQAGREIAARWDEVSALSFARDPFLGARGAHVSTRGGEFAFVVEGTRGKPRDAFDIPALENGSRLCEIIVKKARLAATTPGGETYSRLTRA